MLTKLFVLLSVATLVQCTAHLPFWPKGAINSRIFGGVDTPIEKVPWQVSLQINGSHFCGGVIYSTNIIVTAAHCLKDKNLQRYSVRVGSSSSNESGTLIAVAKLTEHECYNANLITNDIALVLLSHHLEMSAKVKAIPLAKSEPKDNAKVLVSGWGLTETGLPTTLQSVHVNIVSRNKCAELYKHHRSPITNSSICAAAPGKDSCEYDSGGPLVHNHKLVGIVSWGDECAVPNYPGVYTSVAKFRKWIVREAKKLNST